MAKSKGRKAQLKDWNRLLKDHPEFARSHLAQQAALMEASLAGDELVTARMCKLLATDLPIVFRDFWVQRCRDRLPPEGIWKCLTESNRDPADCFDIKGDWFNDPFNHVPGLDR